MFLITYNTKEIKNQGIKAYRVYKCIQEYYKIGMDEKKYYLIFDFYDDEKPILCKLNGKDFVLLGNDRWNYEIEKNDYIIKGNFRELLNEKYYFYYYLKEFGSYKEKLDFKNISNDAILFLNDNFNLEMIILEWLKYLIERAIVSGTILESGWYVIVEKKELSEGIHKEWVVYRKENNQMEIFIISNEETLLKAIQLGVFDEFRLSDGSYYYEGYNFEFYYERRSSSFHLFKIRNDFKLFLKYFDIKKIHNV